MISLGVKHAYAFKRDTCTAKRDATPACNVHDGVCSSCIQVRTCDATERVVIVVGRVLTVVNETQASQR